MTQEELLEQSRARRSLRPAFARAVRMEARVSQADLGALVGVTAGAVLRWERGERSPRGPLAVRYRQALMRLEAGSRD